MLRYKKDKLCSFRKNVEMQSKYFTPDELFLDYIEYLSLSVWIRNNRKQKGTAKQIGNYHNVVFYRISCSSPNIYEQYV